MDPGLPRPEYLSPSGNAHPGNYGNLPSNLSFAVISFCVVFLLSSLFYCLLYALCVLRYVAFTEGGGESRGNGGPYWTANLNNSTSHYGNLPVRPYLLQEGTSPNASNNGAHGLHDTFNHNNHIHQVVSVPNDGSSQMQMDVSSSGELQMIDNPPPPIPHHHSHPPAGSSSDAGTSGTTNHSPGLKSFNHSPTTCLAFVFLHICLYLNVYY